MGGEISLDGAAGEGSTFRVVLPLPELPDTDSDAAHEAPASAMPCKALDILLVEDDTTVAAVIAGLLESQGHRVRHVANGLAALSELEAAGFNTALIDLDLPGVDGLALARMIRAREEKSGKIHLPLIAVTARSGGDEEAQCLAAGMDGFLRKPVSGQMLSGCIERACSRRPVRNGGI